MDRFVVNAIPVSFEFFLYYFYLFKVLLLIN